MTPLGKIAPAEFERLIAPRLGARRDDVLLGPGVGRDSAIVKVGAGRVMAVTTDPLSLIPAIGAADSAWLACHLLASDLWTSGIPPTLASVCLSMPPDLAESDVEAYWTAMSAEFEHLGIAVVTGHTGRYAGCALPILGAATLFGLGDEGRTIGPAHVKPGDRVLVTKGCAIETTAIAARLFPKRLATRVDEELVVAAAARFHDTSVVADCRAALRVGVRDRGVSALHDATEGGVLGGLLELAKAAGADFRVEQAKLPLSDVTRAACELMQIDPLWSLSEGTLIATVRASYAAEVLAAFATEKILAADVGEVVKGSGVVWFTDATGDVTRLDTPRPDGYWQAYDRAVREGWS